MKKSVFKIVSILTFALTLTLLLSACLFDGKEGNEATSAREETEMAENKEIIIFENGEYQCAFVYPNLAEPEVSNLRNAFRGAFKAKTGVNPIFKSDDKIDEDPAVFEVLIGLTNRAESGAPEGVSGETDAFYSVSVVGNKLVINGSDAYHLSLAINYFVDQYLSGDPADRLVVSADLNEQKISKDFSRDGWKLTSIPAYSAGVNHLVQNVYHCGSTFTKFSSTNVNQSSTQLHLIQKTNVTEFSNYCSKLESFGYEKEASNDLEGNLYATYYNGERRVHVSFNPAYSEARVILDPDGISAEEFGYTYTPKEGEQSEYYLYGIPMANGKSNPHPNCGTLMVIKCADNSVIIIDGGAYEGDGGTQMYGDDVMQAFDDFLHEITNTPAGQKVRISAWYMTHYHSDHIYGLLEFLKRYYDSYELERIVANIPIAQPAAQSWGTMAEWHFKLIGEWNILLKTKFPNCKELKVHSGQTIQIADVTLQVLYTHEDLLTSNAMFNSTDSNDTSTVIRVDNGKMSMMVLGDANTRTESRIRRCFTTTTLKSDICQAAHHIINDLSLLYKDIQPTYMYIPQSEECCHSPMVEPATGLSYQDRYDRLLAVVPEENCYFGGNETVGYAVINGVMTECYYKEGVVGRQE